MKMAAIIFRSIYSHLSDENEILRWKDPKRWKCFFPPPSNSHRDNVYAFIRYERRNEKTEKRKETKTKKMLSKVQGQNANEFASVLDSLDDRSLSIDLLIPSS